MFNKVLIIPVHECQTLYDILPRSTGVKYLTFIDACPGYHNLKLDEQSSYLTTFSCLFDESRYIQLSFGVAPAGDMFLKKIGGLFHGISNVFGIADYILTAGFNELGKDHNSTLDKVLRICRQVNLKLIRDKCFFRCTSMIFLEKYFL